MLKIEFPGDHDVETPINSTESRLAKTLAKIIHRQMYGIAINVTEGHGKNPIKPLKHAIFLTNLIGKNTFSTFRSAQKGPQKIISFRVALCTDVFMELLCFGDRRCLAKLETIGQRFHRIVNFYFGACPFLRLDLSMM